MYICGLVEEMKKEMKKEMKPANSLPLSNYCIFEWVLAAARS
jgi:hypothetical protein